MATNRPSIQQVFAISVALSGVIAGSVAWHYFGGDPWAVAIALQVVGMVATVIPVGQALLERIDLNAAPTWIEHSVHLGAQRDRVLDHYARIKGTLVYWKNQAAAHSRLHSASVTWSLLSAVLLPVLVQYHDQSNDAANAFLTMLTTWTGLVVAVASALKSEQRYQGMRQTESDYYDRARSFLDSLVPNDPNLKEKVDDYFADVERIRKTARKVETGSPPSAFD